MLAEAVESRRLTEKMRFVGADAIEHAHHFLRIRTRPAVIRGEGIQLKGAESAPQAAYEHGAILCAEMDSRFAENQDLKQAELFRRELGNWPAERQRRPSGALYDGH